MVSELGFQRVSESQSEILVVTMMEVGEMVDKFYVQGKITEDDRGNVPGAA